MEGTHTQRDTHAEGHTRREDIHMEGAYTWTDIHKGIQGHTEGHNKRGGNYF